MEFFTSKEIALCLYEILQDFPFVNYHILNFSVSYEYFFLFFLRNKLVVTGLCDLKPFGIFKNVLIVTYNSIGLFCHIYRSEITFGMFSKMTRARRSNSLL